MAFIVDFLVLIVTLLILLGSPKYIPMYSIWTYCSVMGLFFSVLVSLI